MGEDPVKKQLNRAKKNACKVLSVAGYKIERASNDIYCVVAMRDTEWRAIKIAIPSIIKCAWFLEEIKRFERLPCPDTKCIKKEIWLRKTNEQAFVQLHWENNKWFTEDDKSVNLYQR